MDVFPINRDLSPVTIQNKFLEKSSQYRDNAISFYTDGSKLSKDVPTGVGVFSPNLHLCITHKLPPETSIFTAEAWAILLAIKINASFGANCVKTTIFLDSKSILDTLSSPIPSKNYLIHNIKKRLLDSSREGRVIYLFWLPAHKGIPGNETADSLAKEVSHSSYKPSFKIPYTDLFSEAKEFLDKEFSAYLEEAARTTGSQHAFLYQNYQNIRLWYFKKPLNRKDIVSINRLRSNHYNFNFSLYRKNMVTSTACPCGNLKQDINHIIFPALSLYLNLFI